MDKVICPVCGKHEFLEPGTYEICPVCGWWEDYYQLTHPDRPGGGNLMSLNEARKAYKEGRPIR